MFANPDQSPILLVHPWVRLWARSIDLFIFGIVYAISLDMIGPPISDKYVLTCFLLVFLWVPTETILLWTWGTTPGKWLLRMQLHETTGTGFTFRKAFRRSLDVWIWGMGIGFIWATWVGLLMSYLDLKERGSTRWDRAEGILVSHGSIGVNQVIGTIICVPSFAAIIVLLHGLLTTRSLVAAGAHLFFVCIFGAIAWAFLKVLVMEETPVGKE